MSETADPTHHDEWEVLLAAATRAFARDAKVAAMVADYHKRWTLPGKADNISDAGFRALVSAVYLGEETTAP